MIQFNENDVCKLIKAVTWYRDMQTGTDYMWDEYNTVLTKLIQYGEDASPKPVDCPTDK